MQMNVSDVEQEIARLEKIGRRTAGEEAKLNRLRAALRAYRQSNWGALGATCA